MVIAQSGSNTLVVCEKTETSSLNCLYTKKALEKSDIIYLTVT